MYSILKVNISEFEIITNGSQKLFPEPRKINIADAAKAGLALDKTMQKKFLFHPSHPVQHLTLNL